MGDRIPAAPATAIALLALAALSGCSISASAVSLSRSSESFSRSSGSVSASASSSSRSSAPSDEQAAYRREVRDHTAAYVRAGGDLDALLGTVSAVARRHGIVDWEADRDTWLGIGAGLAKGGVPESSLVTWVDRLGGTDPARRDAIRAGYAAYASGGR